MNTEPLITPERAVRVAQAFARLYEKLPRTIPPNLYGKYKGDDADYLHTTMNMIESAQKASVILWRRDLWDAALRGGEVFMEERPDEKVFPFPPQVWLLDQPYPAEEATPPEALDAGLSYWFAGCFLFSLQLGSQAAIWALDLFYPEDPRVESNLYGGILPSNDRHFQPADQPWGTNFFREAAGLHFLALDFVKQEPATFPRPFRRKYERKREAVPAVNIVTLRRTAREENEDGEGREYACQWLVSGHWRRPNARMKEQRPVYVRPHVKGPADKPLKAPRDTVYVVSR